MFYVVTSKNGETKSKLYLDWDEYYRDTFSPGIEVLGFVSFIVRGKTYDQKKNVSEIS